MLHLQRTNPIFTTWIYGRLIT